MRQSILLLLMALAMTVCVRAASFESLLTVTRRFSQPLISWTNRAGEISTILERGKLDVGDWAALVEVTTDNRTLQWLDERPQVSARFYTIASTTETNQAARLQGALDRTRRSLGLRGVSAAVITTNGLWLGTSGTSFGTASVRPWMRFSMGSVTKTFTAALIMRLSEEGKLGLDDPIGKWLPPYPNVPNTVTIRQLLSHTSGIYNYTEHPNFWPMVSRTNKVYAPTDALALVLAPNFAAGESWAYSNTGYTLLGLIAEAVTHRSFAAEVRHRFLEPLGIEGIYLQGNETASVERVHGWSRDFSGSLEDINSRSTWPVVYPVAWSAGAMAATARDLAIWTRALYGGSVVTPETMKQMTEWHAVSSASYGLGYGLGTMRLASPKGDFWGHTGTITGFRTHAGHSPALDATMVIMINQDGGEHTAIWDALVQQL